MRPILSKDHQRIHVLTIEIPPHTLLQLQIIVVLHFDEIFFNDAADGGELIFFVSELSSIETYVCCC